MVSYTDLLGVGNTPVSLVSGNSKLSIELKILDPRVSLAYSTAGSAGLDLMAALSEGLELAPGEVVLVPTGISVNIKDPNYAAVILPRSGLGHNKGIILGNSVGLIDADYQGEIKMSLLNRSAESYTVKPLDRVAQLVFIPISKPNIEVVQEFSTETDRGTKGFGSTGVSNRSCLCTTCTKELPF